mgnify:CR=1 FL=1
MEGQVEIVEDDYRNIRGECDAFVSVGMLEHVGPENYGELGAVIDRCLAIEDYEPMSAVEIETLPPVGERQGQAVKTASK